MNLMTLNDDVQTMTSREIAELTGKRHDHVLRDIEKLSPNLGTASKTTTYQDMQNIARKMWLLSKRDTLLLISGYNAELRARIIDRWEELESKQRQPAINLHDPKQLLGLLQNYAEENLKLQEKVEEAAPKVEFVERYVDSDGLLGFREVAKMLKVTEVVLRDWLISKSIIYRLGSGWAFSSSFLTSKRGEHRTGTYGGKVRTSIKFTPKGFAYVAERILKKNKLNKC